MGEYETNYRIELRKYFMTHNGEKSIIIFSLNDMHFLDEDDKDLVKDALELIYKAYARGQDSTINY